MSPTTPNPIILASGSVSRRSLLDRLGMEFGCISPDIDESPMPDEPPQQLALRLACSKAKAISNNHPEAIVIGSDQVAVVGPVILGKPGNQTKAALQLAQCSGKTVNFYTAVCVSRLSDAFQETHTDLTSVRFRSLNAADIDHYLAIEKPWDCAGSFKSEGLGISLFESIENKDPTALIGLPLIWLTGCLQRTGINLLG
jgi:septum formation protein